MLFRERKKNSEYHSFRMFFVRSRIECSCSLRSRLAIVLAGRLVSFKGEEQDEEAIDPWGALNLVIFDHRRRLRSITSRVKANVVDGTCVVYDKGNPSPI